MIQILQLPHLPQTMERDEQVVRPKRHTRRPLDLEDFKLEDTLFILDSYSNSLYPQSDTMAALTAQYGQPHQLALKRTAELIDGANIRDGDYGSFCRFALIPHALVGQRKT